MRASALQVSIHGLETNVIICGWSFSYLLPSISRTVSSAVNENDSDDILILVVFKKGSSTLAVVASAARLALSNVGFLIPVLAGEALRTTLSYYDIGALFILILGIVVYRLKAELKQSVEQDKKPLINEN